MGVETVGRVLPRSEYAQTVVFDRSFWLQSTKTFPRRSSLSHDHRDAFGSSCGEQLAEGAREEFRVVVGHLGVQGHREMEPFEPGCLNHCLQAQLVEELAELDADARSSRGCRRRARIEVEHHRVGSLLRAHGVPRRVCSSSAARLAIHTSVGELVDHTADDGVVGIAIGRACAPTRTRAAEQRFSKKRSPSTPLGHRTIVTAGRRGGGAWRGRRGRSSRRPAAFVKPAAGTGPCRDSRDGADGLRSRPCSPGACRPAGGRLRGPRHHDLRT